MLCKSGTSWSAVCESTSTSCKFTYHSLELLSAEAVVVEVLDVVSRLAVACDVDPPLHVVVHRGQHVV